MIGWFFFELLVLGAVSDYKSATTFRLFDKATWHFYIEVLSIIYKHANVLYYLIPNNRFIACTKLYISFQIPSSYSSDPTLSMPCQLANNLSKFQELLPIFKHIGQKVVTGSINDFHVGCELQLVCKYLQTHENTKQLHDCKFYVCYVFCACLNLHS